MAQPPIRVGDQNRHESCKAPDEQGGQEVLDQAGQHPGVLGPKHCVQDRVQLGDDVLGGGEEQGDDQQDKVDDDLLQSQPVTLVREILPVDVARQGGVRDSPLLRSKAR